MKSHAHGFTIIELLIVIITLGILSSIIVIGWNNVASSSGDKARAADIKQWVSTFELYKSRFTVWPALPIDFGGGIYALGACLGQTSFMNSVNYPDRNGYCGQYNNAYKRLPAADSADLVAQVKKVGNEPMNSGPITKNTAVGPFLFLWQSSAGSTIKVNGYFIGYFESGCPSDIPAVPATDPAIPQVAASYALLTGFLSGLPSGVTACGVFKTFTYTT